VTNRRDRGLGLILSIYRTSKWVHENIELDAEYAVKGPTDLNTIARSLANIRTFVEKADTPSLVEFDPPYPWRRVNHEAITMEERRARQ
jgi:hypothetical protein